MWLRIDREYCHEIGRKPRALVFLTMRLDVTDDGSKVRCFKEQYCIGTWNVRSMNQGKLEVVKRDGKSECRHSRSQQTEMDWNG